jgi:hypothetical protein
VCKFKRVEKTRKEEAEVEISNSFSKERNEIKRMATRKYSWHNIQ